MKKWISSLGMSGYEGHAKSSITYRHPWFYTRYILKCFTALEWCVHPTIPVYFVQIAFQMTELFQIEIDAVIYTDQFTCYNKKHSVQHRYQDNTECSNTSN